jgi:anthranilate synthase component 2
MTGKILLLDNYDSFTYNLLHYVEEVSDRKVDVFRNDEITLEQIAEYNQIILSPGPGLPHEAGILMPLIREYASAKRIFGVCLGLQAITEVYGGKLKQLETVMHGRSRRVMVKDGNHNLFKGLPSSFMAGRYHSWVADRDNFPDCLVITADDEESNIMAIRHKTHDVSAVQFHPESIMTEYGKQMIRNWIQN